MFGSSKQTIVGLLVAGGLLVIVLGVMAAPFLFFGALFIILIGLAMAGIGVYYGLTQTFGDDRKRPVTIEEGVYVMNIIVTDRQGEHVFNPEMFDDHEIRFFIQIAFPDGRREEFETNRHVAESMGEGMRGKITYQGKWMNQFEPHFG